VLRPFLCLSGLGALSGTGTEMRWWPVLLLAGSLFTCESNIDVTLDPTKRSSRSSSFPAVILQDRHRPASSLRGKPDLSPEEAKAIDANVFLRTIVCQQVRDMLPWIGYELLIFPV
jgi:hypothetical protein